MSSVLSQGGYLTTNETLVSNNGCFFAVMQGDGNFCVYRGSGPANTVGTAMWNSQSAQSAGDFFLAMQADGNLCVYPGTPTSPTGGALWHSGNAQSPASYGLIMQDDGNLCVYSDSPSNSNCVWNASVTDPITDVVNITNLVYQLDKAKVIPGDPDVIYNHPSTNSTSVAQTQTLSGSTAVNDTEGWSDTLGLKIGVKTSFEVGIPVIAEGKVEVSAEVSNAYTWNGSITTSNTWSWSANVVVPPQTTVLVNVAVAESTITVPYTITGTVLYTSGAKLTTSLPGTYTGLNAHDITTTYSTPTGEAIQGPLTYQKSDGKTAQGISRSAVLASVE